eukprot:jgi/Mesen1/6614/ME000034S06065
MIGGIPCRHMDPFFDDEDIDWEAASTAVDQIVADRTLPLQPNHAPPTAPHQQPQPQRLLYQQPRQPPAGGPSPGQRGWPTGGALRPLPTPSPHGTRGILYGVNGNRGQGLENPYDVWDFRSIPPGGAAAPESRPLPQNTREPPHAAGAAAAAQIPGCVRGVFGPLPGGGGWEGAASSRPGSGGGGSEWVAADRRAAMQVHVGTMREVGRAMLADLGDRWQVPSVTRGNQQCRVTRRLQQGTSGREMLTGGLILSHWTGGVRAKREDRLMAVLRVQRQPAPPGRQVAGPENGHTGREEKCGRADLLQPHPAHEVDEEAAATWIYPENKERREYQFRMAQTALFANTLVCLPTGLGKTLIAAVVMCNYFRWFPRGKIVFLAPTNALVWQQIEACHQIMGIPQDQSVFMTGHMKKQERAAMWATRRVFFVTGQILERDIVDGQICPVQEIVLLVVDEAHRATGNAAYCVAVEQLMGAKAKLRILALTATPGGNMMKIQSVIDNLKISELEHRDESHPEVKQHMQSRQLSVQKVESNDTLKAIQALLVEELRQVAKPLGGWDTISDKDASKDNIKFEIHKNQNVQIGAYTYLSAHQRFRATAGGAGEGDQLDPGRMRQMEQAFMAAHGLATVCERMATHGVQMALPLLEDQMRKPWMRKSVPQLREAARKMEQAIALGGASPKLDKLEAIVREHFGNHDPLKTRIIIFTSYRESVQ